MNKKVTALCIIIFLLILVAVLIFVPLPVYDGAYVGMSDENFHNLFPDNEAFHYMYYSFYTNSIGDYVVARVYNHQIVELKCIRKLTTNPSEANFNRIKDGTDLVNVVAMVGIPYDSFTSGMSTCAFHCSNGKSYTIFWNPVKTDNGIKFVSSDILSYE